MPGPRPEDTSALDNCYPVARCAWCKQCWTDGRARVERMGMSVIVPLCSDCIELIDDITEDRDLDALTLVADPGVEYELPEPPNEDDKDEDEATTSIDQELP